MSECATLSSSPGRILVAQAQTTSAINRAKNNIFGFFLPNFELNHLKARVQQARVFWHLTVQQDHCYGCNLRNRGYAAVSSIVDFASELRKFDV